MPRVFLFSVVLFLACGSGAGDGAPDVGKSADDLGAIGKPTDVVEPPDTLADASEDAGPDSADADSADTNLVDVGTPDAWKTCPVAEPGFGAGAGESCEGSLHCTYGKECCCGQCSDSSVCDCQGGKFICYATDFCFFPQCSPGCSVGQYATPSGCQTCAVIEKELPIALAAALTPLDGCSSDAECVTLPMSNFCNSSCSVALPAAQTQTGHGLLGQMSQQWCGNWGGLGCYVPCAQTGKPACVQGHCRLVGVCDPQVTQNGSPCDDGDACTTGDACTGPGKCAGKPSVCDDDNPCTLDGCTKASGCNFTPVSGSCASDVACSLGGTCKQGQCVDSGSKGWQVTLPKPDSDLQGALTRLTDGSFVVVHRVLGKLDVRAIHVDAQGKVLWDNPTVAQGVISDVRGLADGEVMLAGHGGGPMAVDLKAVLWRLDAQGKLKQTVEVPAPGANSMHLALRPEGGFVLAGATTPKPNEWHAWVARLDSSGKLLGTLDLGPASDAASQTHVAARTGATAVWTTIEGLPLPSVGSQSDLRFVRLDANGAIAVDATVLPAPTYDRSGGVIALADGWLASAWTTDYLKGKEGGGLLVRLNDTGQVVWQKAGPTLGGWLIADGAGGLAVSLENVGSPAGVWHVWQVDGAGTLTGDLQVPDSLLGNGAKWVAPTGDGGALFAAVTGSGAPVKLLRVVPKGVGCP